MIHFFKKIKISVFIKILVMLLLITLLFYALNMVLNILNEKNINENVILIETTKIDYFIENFEREIKRITKLQNEYIADSSLQKLSMISEYLNSYEKTKNIKEFQFRLNLLKNSSSYISDVKAHIIDLEKTISAKDGYIDFMNYEYFLSDNSIFPIKNIDDSIFTNITNPTYNNLQPNLYYVLTVELSKKTILEDIKRIIGDSNQGLYVSYLDNNSELLSAYNSSTKDVHTAIVNKINKIDLDDNISVLNVIDDEYNIYNKKSEYLGLNFLYYFPTNIAIPSLNIYKKIQWIITIVTIFIITIFYIWSYMILKKPLNTIIHAFEKVKSGKYDYIIKHKSNDEFGYIYANFNSMIAEINQLIKNISEQKINLKQAALKQLQYQINPHFLYNSFYNIYRMSKTSDFENISKLSLALNKFYRFLNKNLNNEIPIIYEIEHCLTYIEIQTLRYHHQVSVKFDYDKNNLSDIKIPPSIYFNFLRLSRLFLVFHLIKRVYLMDSSHFNA